jgi:hypothetical protein
MDLIDNVKQRATAQLDSQKGRATDSISTIANAVRGTTSQLRNEQHDVLAQYVEKAADQLERFSANLRDKDMTELLDGARSFARRQPALFVGGSLVAGLLAARFLKSSGQNDSGDRYRANGIGRASSEDEWTGAASARTETW